MTHQDYIAICIGTGLWLMAWGFLYIIVNAMTSDEFPIWLVCAIGFMLGCITAGCCLAEIYHV